MAVIQCHLLIMNLCLRKFKCRVGCGEQQWVRQCSGRGKVAFPASGQAGEWLLQWHMQQADPLGLHNFVSSAGWRVQHSLKQILALSIPKMLLIYIQALLSFSLRIRVVWVGRALTDHPLQRSRLVLSKPSLELPQSLCQAFLAHFHWRIDSVQFCYRVLLLQIPKFHLDPALHDKSCTHWKY